MWRATAAATAVASTRSTAASARCFSTHAHAAKPRVLVVGGSGALGSAMIDTFKNAGWKTICMDYRANPASETNITLSSASTWKANLTLAEMQISELAEKAHHKSHQHSTTAAAASSSSSSTKPSAPLSVVIHCAGSWLGGGVASSELVESVDPMLDINLKSAVSAAYLAGKFLTDSGAGMLMLTGAAAAASSSAGSALQPTSGMLAYGMSKAATHHLALSLAQPDSGMPRASTVVCILPTMIDTPTNRKMTTNEAEYANWTPPRDFAQLALSFAQQLQAKAHGGKDTTHAASTEHQTSVPLKHGGFYKFSTEKGKTRIEML